ncbi:MAG: 30S ribosomal protein S1 [Candidatus Eremiobacteraeota bacterium]|nr:30S ribosomal protein S1 [Candidatus Eremiobacteraeota bacterium]
MDNQQEIRPDEQEQESTIDSLESTTDSQEPTKDSLETPIDSQEPTKDSLETPTDSQESAKDSMEITMASHEDYEKSFKTIARGDYLVGQVVKLDENGVYVDIGYKQEGFIPLNQLTHKRAGRPDEVVQVGDEIPIVVLKCNDMEGDLILSKKRADLETSWRNVTKAYHDGSIVTATVVEHVKGGLLVDLGLRGFIPASQVDIRPVKDLSEFVGEALRLKVIELDRSRRKVVLSRKKVLEDEKVRLKDDTLNSLYEGQIVKGIVARLTNFGSFVNLGGVDGLIHISELAWKRIKHPSEVVKIGDNIDVMVLKVDTKRERISLSLRQALPDPWSMVRDKMTEGDIVTGNVTKIAKRYVFIEVMDGVEGVIPLHELAHGKMVNPSTVLKEGEDVKVKVLEIHPEARRMVFSYRQANSMPEKEDSPGFSTSQSSGATIGDILRAKLRESSDKEKSNGAIGKLLMDSKKVSKPGKKKQQKKEVPKKKPADSTSVKVESPKAEVVEEVEKKEPLGIPLQEVVSEIETPVEVVEEEVIIEETPQNISALKEEEEETILGIPDEKEDEEEILLKKITSSTNPVPAIPGIKPISYGDIKKKLV